MRGNSSKAATTESYADSGVKMTTEEHNELMENLRRMTAEVSELSFRAQFQSSVSGLKKEKLVQFQRRSMMMSEILSLSTNSMHTSLTPLLF